MQLKKLFVLVSFFAITPLFLIFSIIYLSFLNYSADPSNRGLFSLKPENVSYAALPGTDITFQASIQESDGRVAKLEQFFAKYNSPLEPYAQNIVDTADKYNISYKLLPAIAGQESGWCKHIIVDSHNCWGWGIYKNHTTTFSDYPTAIDTVSRGLAKNYVKKGMTTPAQIMQVYNPTSNANGGTWAEGVSYFLGQLE
ncbi:MAG TPA: hypothetical protein VLF89_04320 [Candidatus Saccharimonadales bacterium]|nr:hypothetical protein [Candidatus Saccharimonadales bacterium]